MRIVIETDDFGDRETLEIFLRHMQEESDDQARDYGDPSLALSSGHMAMSVRIIGLNGE